MNQKSDYVIVGAGIFGLYAAHLLTAQKFSVTVIEKAPEAFTKASYVNQARVHNGYHYPRSLGTAAKAERYFKRFTEKFDFAIVKSFEKIYAVSERFSYVSADNFRKFCRELGLPCEEIDATRFFNPGLIEAAFRTQEYAFDAPKIRDYLLLEIQKSGCGTILYNTAISHVENTGTAYRLTLRSGDTIETPHVLNATYSGINDVISLFDFEPFELKHEACEIALCTVSPSLQKTGITVIDGPFFSLMPFGESGLHSLSAVSYTPSKTSATLAPEHTGASGWVSMNQLAKKYLSPEHSYAYARSLYTTKTVLKSAELDDSRPTIIKEHKTTPRFTSIFSGKISSIFDLDDHLL